MVVMMRSSFLLALLALMVVVSQFSVSKRDQDAPASKEGGAVILRASYASPVRAQANAASGPVAAAILASGPKEQRGGSKEQRDRFVLIFANALSLILSLFPFALRWGYGSWYITRAIFPAKGVACNFVASGVWTGYVILEMYADHSYHGEEALMVNFLTMGFNLVTLFIYFLHGEETKKFWFTAALFMTVALGGLVWLIWHPNTIRSDTRKTALRKDTVVFGFIGMVLFATMNLIPFADLCTMSCGGENGSFTLLFPMVVNIGLSSVANVLWTVYAWLCAPQNNYFVYANGMATFMTSVQGAWILILCLKYKDDGLITEVGILRSAFLSVKRSLEKLGDHGDGLWKHKNFVTRLELNLKNAEVSFQEMGIIIYKLESELNKAAIRAGTTGPVEGQTVLEKNCVDTCRRAALEQFPFVRTSCVESLIAIETIGLALGRLSDLHDAADILAVVEELNGLVKDAGAAIGSFAKILPTSMQVINASQGIPSTLRVAFDRCCEKMFILNVDIDSEVLNHSLVEWCSNNLLVLMHS